MPEKGNKMALIPKRFFSPFRKNRKINHFMCAEAIRHKSEFYRLCYEFSQGRFRRKSWAGNFRKAIFLQKNQKPTELINNLGDFDENQ